MHPEETKSTKLIQIKKHNKNINMPSMNILPVCQFACQLQHIAKPWKHWYVRRSERSRRIYNVSESGIQKHSKTSKTNICIFAEVSVGQGFAMFRRMPFKQLSKPIQKHWYFRRSEPSTRIYNIPESGVQKHNKTIETTCIFVDVCVVQGFVMFRKQLLPNQN